MNSKRDFDRAVDRWLDDGSDATPPEVINAILLAVRSTPQERDFRVPWRSTTMTTYLRVAAVIALAVIGSTAAISAFGPREAGLGGPNTTPSPSAALLARGNFVAADGAVDLEATGEGTTVMGRMIVTEVGFDAAFTVDLQCARTTGPVSVAGERAEDGLIMIAGITTDTTGGGSALSPEGTWAAIVLKRGSPVEASIWSQRGGPTSEAASCLAYLDEQLMEEPSRNTDGDWLSPIEGTVELGP